MPLTAKGETILRNLEKEYPTEVKAKEVLYAGKNAGTFSGIDAAQSNVDAYHDALRRGDSNAVTKHFPRK